jgi:hypothetical protein
MKWERLKKVYRHDGGIRSWLEPIKPSPGIPTYTKVYAFRFIGSKHCCMCYCRPRYDWIIRSMVKHGISAEHFAQKEIPEEKCQEIAKMLNQMLKDGDYEDAFEPDLIKTDIAFWSHCGGVRVHDWLTYAEAYQKAHG